MSMSKSVYFGLQVEPRVVELQTEGSAVPEGDRLVVENVDVAVEVEVTLEHADGDVDVATSRGQAARGVYPGSARPGCR